MYKIVLFMLIGFTYIFASSKYELGDGYSLIDEYLYVGGYFSTNYENSRYISGASFDDVGLLLYGSSAKTSYLVEFESLNPYQYDFVSDTTKKHTNIYTKRAFVKYQISDNSSLRVGKFYTPVGFYNEIPINVLRDTTSSPLTSQKLYPEYTTGLNYRYTNISSSSLQLDVIAQHSNDIDQKYNNSKVKEHYSVSLSYNKDEFTYKLGAGYYKESEKKIYFNDGDNDKDDYIKDFYAQKSNDKYQYFIIGMKYESEHWLFQSELGRNYKNSQLDIYYMGYIQSIYRYKKSSFILRYENYLEDNNERKHDRFSVIGYTYRPYYPVAFKVEYQLHELEQKSKAVFSLSILF